VNHGERVDIMRNQKHFSEEEQESELPKSFCSATSFFQWVTSDFRVGNFVIFDARAVHASTSNNSNRFRISVDMT